MSDLTPIHPFVLAFRVTELGVALPADFLTRQRLQVNIEVLTHSGTEDDSPLRWDPLDAFHFRPEVIEQSPGFKVYDVRLAAS